MSQGRNFRLQLQLQRNLTTRCQFVHLLDGEQGFTTRIKSHTSVTWYRDMWTSWKLRLLKIKTRKWRESASPASLSCAPTVRQGVSRAIVCSSSVLFISWLLDTNATDRWFVISRNLLLIKRLPNFPSFLNIVFTSTSTAECQFLTGVKCSREESYLPVILIKVDLFSIWSVSPPFDIELDFEVFASMFSLLSIWQLSFTSP